MVRTERQTKTSGDVPTADVLTQLALTVYHCLRSGCEMALTKAPPRFRMKLVCDLLGSLHPTEPLLTSVRYSAWCFVATNTTVWSWGRTTLRSR